jgi:uncharacterized protein
MSGEHTEVEVIDADSQRVLRERLTLRANARVADALSASTFERAAEILGNAQSVTHAADSFVGVWGRRVLIDTPLQNGDRIELYRALIADAKSTRLKRASEQGYRWQGRTRRAAK